MSERNLRNKPAGKLTNAAGGNMMFSETDLLYRNTFVQDIMNDVPSDKATNFKVHREKKNKEAEKKAQLEVVKRMNEPVLPDKLAAYQNKLPPKTLVPAGPGEIQQGISRTIEVKRKIFIDSRHRNKDLYPDSSDFAISWGRIFQNVKNMKLVSLEFPNVVPSVNHTNNRISWINLEDADLDPPFPIYTVELNVGSYILQTIATEITTRCKSVRRRGGLVDSAGNLPPFHYFIMETNQETDYIGLTSIIAKSALANPITVVRGSKIVTFRQANHGYVNNERIHILGAMGALGSIRAADINGAYLITVIDPDTFTFEIKSEATDTSNGGGSYVETGRESPFQFLFGSSENTIASILGFPEENSSISIPFDNPITSNIKIINDVIPGNVFTQIVSVDHRLLPGENIFLQNFHVSPSIYENPKNRGIATVYSVPSPDVFIIKYGVTRVSDITNAFVGTQSFSMYYPNHGFNRIVDIVQAGPNAVKITTLFDHGYTSKSTVLISGTNSNPIVDGFYAVIPFDADTFFIRSADVLNPLNVVERGFKGILTSDHTFYLYNVKPFGGFEASQLNDVPFTIRDILDADTFTFSGNYGFSDKAETGGGGQIRINSKLETHGWRGTQNNQINGSLYRPINLCGDNYCYMVIPNLNSDSISNSGPVKDVFCKIFITSVPGVIIFNQFDSSVIDFLKPIPVLSELRFMIISPDNFLISFKGLDYSFGIELTEIVKVDDVNEQSSTFLPPPGMTSRK